jgi:hypothetical protein
MSLENVKSQLLTQLGQVKLSLRNEQDVKKELQCQLKQVDDRMEQLRTQHAQEIIDQNQKLSEIFATKERSWQQRLADLELQCTVLDRENKECCQAAEELQAHIHILEKENQELSKTLAVKQVYEETSQRDLQELQQTLASVEESKQELVKNWTKRQDSAQQDLQHLRESLSELEKAYQEVNKTLAVKEVYEETMKRDLQIHLLEKQNLQKQNQELTNMLDELRINVISELNRQNVSLPSASAAVSTVSSPNGREHQSQPWMTMTSGELRHSPSSSSFSALPPPPMTPLGTLDMQHSPTPAVVLASQFITSNNHQQHTHQHRPVHAMSSSTSLPISSQQQESNRQAQLRRSPPSPKTTLAASILDESVPSVAIPRTNTPPRLRPTAMSSIAAHRNQILQSNERQDANLSTPQPSSRFSMTLNHVAPQWKSPQLTPATAPGGARRSALARQLLQAKASAPAQPLNHQSVATSSNKSASPNQNPASPSSPVLHRSRSDSNRMDDHSVIQGYMQTYPDGEES